MSFYIYNEDGYIGDAGSNTGWKALCDFLKMTDNAAAKSLVRDGWSDGIDFSNIPDPADKDVLATFNNLKKLAMKCKEVLIISDGQDLSEELE